MTQRLSSGPTRLSRLPLLSGALPSLDRHPKDGYQLAEPYPMGESTRRGLRALIVALCPSSPAPLPADLIDRVEATTRRFMQYMHPLVSRGLWFVLVLLDFAPLFFSGVGRRLHELDSLKARTIVRALAHTRFAPLRTAILGIRGLVLSTYFDQQEVHEAIGYHPVPFIRDRLERRRLLTEVAPVAAE